MIIVHSQLMNQYGVGSYTGTSQFSRLNWSSNYDNVATYHIFRFEQYCLLIRACSESCVLLASTTAHRVRWQGTHHCNLYRTHCFYNKYWSLKPDTSLRFGLPRRRLDPDSPDLPANISSGRRRFPIPESGLICCH
jgi:hypothetical protein